ncbi:MAG: hypothetical protein IKN27_00425, partial [Selenomonadaceae bacterium]|nr:hypothetical protein [Selenomonadaceae bacterium]
FLTAQGIRVANRLSAVNEDTYNLVKTKFTEQPKVEEPEPPKVEEPAPKVEQPKAEQNDAAPSPKKKKKNKAQQPTDGTQPPTIQMQPQQNLSDLNAATQAVYNEAIKAGNEFIGHYKQVNEKKTDIAGNGMGVAFDSFGLLFSGKVYNADESPALYWRAVNKLTTAAYRKIQRFGLKHKEELAEMREAMKEVGAPYVPREIFTDEENERFAKQQRFLFNTFGHGQGALNDELLALKIYCERMGVKFEQMNFVDYLINPDSEFHVKPRVPYSVMAEVIAHSMRGFTRRFNFYQRHKEKIAIAVKTFFEWIDGYQKLKEAGAPEAKLQRYMELEEKFIYMTEFMSFDNLLRVPKKEVIPYVNAIEVLNAYRDDLDNPEALATFKYDLRGKVMYFLVKPKEFVFMWQFGEF